MAVSRLLFNGNRATFFGACPINIVSTQTALYLETPHTFAPNFSNLINRTITSKYKHWLRRYLVISEVPVEWIGSPVRQTYLRRVLREASVLTYLVDDVRLQALGFVDVENQSCAIKRDDL